MKEGLFFLISPIHKQELMLFKKRGHEINPYFHTTVKRAIAQNCISLYYLIIDQSIDIETLDYIDFFNYKKV